MWCWRRTEKISWINCERNEDILNTVKEERNILHTMKRRKTDWIGHILRRNCLLKHFIKGKIEGVTEVMGRQGGRSKQLLDDLMEMRGFWLLKEEALYCTLCRPCFGRGYDPVIIYTMEWMNEWTSFTSMYFLFSNMKNIHLSHIHQILSQML
jgi:hypothetical protein